MGVLDRRWTVEINERAVHKNRNIFRFIQLFPDNFINFAPQNKDNMPLHLYMQATKEALMSECLT